VAPLIRSNDLLGTNGLLDRLRVSMGSIKKMKKLKSLVKGGRELTDHYKNGAPHKKGSPEPPFSLNRGCPPLWGSRNRTLSHSGKKSGLIPPKVGAGGTLGGFMPYIPVLPKDSLKQTMLLFTLGIT